jgi:hypothetical protein
MGHHPTYFTQFAAALAEIGYDVLPFCPDPEDFSKRFSTLENSKSQHVGKIFPTQTLTPTPLGRIRPRRFRPHHQAIKQFGEIGSRLRAWEKQSQQKIDAVFFACIYDSQFRHLKYGSPFLGYPWAGLYLHTRSFRMPGIPIPYTGGLPCPERIFTLKSCLGVSLLDEWAENPMRNLVGSGKSVTTFPDFTDVSLPSRNGKNTGLYRKISDFSNQRKIVSLVGHLQRTKGIVEFTNAAKAPESHNTFFFLGGDINWSEITSSEKESLKDDWENIPNLFCHFDRIKDEATLNQVIAISDVIFAAYRDFPNSSNILTKAAYFRKPIIVSDGYLMAERVRKFELGEVVPEGDQVAVDTALQKMLAPSYYSDLAKRAKWDEYNQIHSSKQLLKSFKELFSFL